MYRYDRKLKTRRIQYRKRLALMKKLLPTKTRIKKEDFVAAAVGTGGVASRIADNLGCTRQTVKRLLERPDWAEVAEFVKDEEEKLVDDAKTALRDVLRQRNDLPTASRAAQWVLERKLPTEFGDRKTTVVEGQATVRHEHTVEVAVDALDLPVEVQRELLKAAEKQEGDVIRIPDLVEARVVKSTPLLPPGTQEVVEAPQKGRKKKSK